MSSSATPSAPIGQSEVRVPLAPLLRRLLAIAVAAALLGLGITLSFGYADHDPKPHHVPIAIAAAPGARTDVASALRRTAPGAFTLVDAGSAAAAIRLVRAQRSLGAVIVPARGAVTIVTAGAQGSLAKAAIAGAFTTLSVSMHRRSRLLDVAPLPAGDHAGLASFVFGLGLLIPSVIGGLGLFLLGMRLRLWWRAAAASLFALLSASGCALAVDAMLGALQGAGAELLGIGFLGALSFVLFVVALQAVVGLPGTALAAVAFIFVGNAASGGSVPVDFLPGGFRQIAPWLPNNAIVRATRDVIYFHGHDLGHPLLVLGAWPALALAILASVDLLHLAERRRRPHLAHEIYRTSALAHVGRRIRGGS